jgi:hypothetical protein
MNFIDIQRISATITPAAHPDFILKSIGLHIPHNGGGIRPQLHAIPIRITVVHAETVPLVDPVLIHHARPCVLDMTFPEIAIVNAFHLNFFPLAEFTDQCNPLCRRCKSPEYHALLLDMSSQILIGVKDFPCIKSVKIHREILLYFQITNRQGLFFYSMIVGEAVFTVYRQSAKKDG